MGVHNSLVFYNTVTLRLYRDIANVTVIAGYADGVTHQAWERNLKRDEREISHRYNQEGLSFLTKTLPRIGKAIDIALQGLVPFTVEGFQSKTGEVIPEFLRLITSAVFDPCSGMVRTPLTQEEIAWQATTIRGLRTLVYLTYKLEVPYAKSTEQKVLDAFINTEEEISNQVFSSEAEELITEANELITHILYRCSATGFRPKHGPGAVATGEEGFEKFNFSRSYRSLNREFPLEEYFFLGWTHMVAHKRQVDTLEDLDAPVAKVTLVPKDSRGPRLISCEPLEVQWCQQGIMQRMVSWLESHPVTRRQVNFTCQDINRELARVGSLNEAYVKYTIRWSSSWLSPLGLPVVRNHSMQVYSDSPWVTLDMKDASDRVSLQLVKQLFDKVPLVGPLLASRSVATILPDGRRVVLGKFAPMGSATCFPVEALTFYALAVAALHRRYKSLRWDQVTKSVFVYGDDLIVQQEDYLLIVAALESVGLKANLDKCCVSGFFRESCGLDAYRGVDVTPVRLRKTWSHRAVKDPTQLVSYVSLSNTLSEKGYWRAAEYVAQQVEYLYGTLPAVPYNVSVEEDIPNPLNTYRKGQQRKLSSPTTRVIGFSHDHVTHGYSRPNMKSKGFMIIRTCKDTHQRMVYGWVVVPYVQKRKYNHRNRLFHTLVCGSAGSKRLEDYAVPHRSRLKRGWGVYHSW